MINTPNRQQTVELINEAVQAGARKSKSCEALGINIRIYQRWMQDSKLNSDGHSGAVRPKPGHKLTPQERETVLEVINSQACPPPRVR